MIKKLSFSLQGTAEGGPTDRPTKGRGGEGGEGGPTEGGGHWSKKLSFSIIFLFNSVKLRDKSER